MGAKVLRRGRGHIQRKSGFASDYEKAEQAKNLSQETIEPELVRGDPEKGRRLKAAGKVGHTVRKPHLDALLASSYTTAYEELKRLERDAKNGPLEPDEIRRYVQLVDALAKLGRVEKDHYPDDTQNMTQEELIAAAQEAMKFLKDNQE